MRESSLLLPKGKSMKNKILSVFSNNAVTFSLKQAERDEVIA